MFPQFSLNLTVADRVYVMEPQWNPSVEERAIARVYRLGLSPLYGSL